MNLVVEVVEISEICKITAKQKISSLCLRTKNVVTMKKELPQPISPKDI